jgi:hypothetical protein
MDPIEIKGKVKGGGEECPPHTDKNYYPTSTRP